MSTSRESFLLGLIGDGITASLTPAMQEQEAAEHGLLLLYRPVDTAALGLHGDAAQEALPRLLEAGRQLGFNGFNITHPFKQSVMAHVDEIDEDARRLGAVNTVIFDDTGRSTGHNTDYSGYIHGLRAAAPDADLSHVVQLGAGGAGSAVAYALLRAGTRRLTLIDLDAERASARAAELQGQFPGAEVVARPHDDVREALRTATGFAQATPVGMHSHPGMPVDIDWIQDGTWVSDVVYLPLRTPLVQAATERGLTVVDGGRMAVGQALDAFTLFTGRTPDAARVGAHFARLIDRTQR